MIGRKYEGIELDFCEKERNVSRETFFIVILKKKCYTVTQSEMKSL